MVSIRSPFFNRWTPCLTRNHGDMVGLSTSHFSQMSGIHYSQFIAILSPKQKRPLWKAGKVFFCVKAFSENSLHPLWVPTNFAGLPEKLPQQTWLFCWGHVLGPFIVSAWHCQAAPKIRGPGAPPKGSVSTIQQASIYSTCKFMSNRRILIWCSCFCLSCVFFEA